MSRGEIHASQQVEKNNQVAREVVYLHDDSFVGPLKQKSERHSNTLEIHFLCFDSGSSAGVEIPSVSWTAPADVHHNRSIRGAGEVIYSCWLGIHASGRKRLQCALLKMCAVSKLPVAGDHCGHAIVAVRVCLNRGMRGHEQQDG